ncbi:hypothetical protein O181_054849 [Austropuccinia psidii MF-1]|uniref:Uncharacterized protein n=1 Tax=Austropuccinia psidii MF-1 TaxID=1389203 RepID=A0A9Q3E5D7_9BASI|nr:hypothetical protein [Austropuccinia psidii MF-1]
MYNLKNMQDDDMNIIIELDKQAKIFHQFISLAEKTRPQLQADGANFNLWSQNIVEHDTYEAITSCVHGSDAHKLYQALKDRFNRPLWSSVILHANTIFQNRNDHVNDINVYAMTINVAVQNLENQLGKIDSEMITTLAIFFAFPSMHQHITLMATDPNVKK